MHGGVRSVKLSQMSVGVFLQIYTGVILIGDAMQVNCQIVSGVRLEIVAK